MLVTPRGEPVPPQAIVQRLAAIDARLSLRWVPSVAGPYWGLIERWAPNNPKWESVRRGEHREEDAFDLLAMLPPDASAEEAEGVFLRLFGRVGDAAQEAAAQVERIARANTARKAAVREAFLTEQEDKHARTTKHELELVVGATTAHPISHGVGDSPRAKRRKAAEG